MDAMLIRYIFLSVRVLIVAINGRLAANQPN